MDGSADASVPAPGGAGTDGPGTDGPGAEESGAEESGTEESGTEKSGPEKSGPEGPGTGPTGTVVDPARTRSRMLDAAPETVRTRVAELVSAAVGRIPVPDLPPAVRPVARFAPAKRARAGAGPMLAALAGTDGFADQVSAWWREHAPDEWSAPDADDVTAAATAVIEGRREGAARLREVAERADAARLRAERDAALARADRLAAELDRVTTERDEARAAAAAAADESREEVTKLRARLRDQGVRVRRAEDEVGRARVAVTSGEGELRRELAEACRERDRHREAAVAAENRARRADEDLATARRSALEARRADDARLALLLDTVTGAASGLRHELGLRGGAPGTSGTAAVGPRPAELVESRGGPPAARMSDPAALDRLLALPEVHLIVDGYNVTKTGWPELALATQRERLVAATAPLSARTGAETTLVFDGAGVVGVPTHSVRGVRVLFSDPGELADDLIRSLVAAEPSGRPLVVVTSDRAVADSVRRRGAHPVPSGVLLARLARI